MHRAEQLSLESIRGFLLASDEIRFESQSRRERYAWVEQLLVQHEYPVYALCPQISWKKLEPL